jgi:hypothetical protein
VPRTSALRPRCGPVACALRRWVSAIRISEPCQRQTSFGYPDLLVGKPAGHRQVVDGQAEDGYDEEIPVTQIDLYSRRTLIVA